MESNRYETDSTLQKVLKLDEKTLVKTPVKTLVKTPVKIYCFQLWLLASYGK
jgi:hypothetical protein